ncbi:O-succinylhomoserine sulfhydrylase [Ottowia sp.]|uniref:O-succinylhomoserine sulfhydrylase n=1 Tax=Ottowia sp. TaxID=1898956 RepID=UPI002BDEA21F|nr:O-succinylhomoserine sulfhydrylase [Ottowia sp.]HRN76875.1 O-succinylhomoserine sulfhydrylase [Ottowia sp.]HRQ03819.1 O-succinylhomoserine sulfhydrylase [Ottowia sp.]
MSTDSPSLAPARGELPPGLHPDTLALRTGIAPSQYGEHSEALYLTSGYVQQDAETSARRFAHPQEGYTYTRTSNPSVTSFERRLAAMEGTESAIGTASGMSAILLMGLGLLKSGDHVICSQSMFGSTIKLFGTDFAKFGVETSFVSQTDAAAWRAALRPSTRLLFAETPTNPLTEVCDIRALAAIAHEAGALLAVDNCFASPALQRPITLGADLVIHSGTKFLDGQGRVMAGAICGPRQYIDQVFWPLIRSTGMVLSPFNAWVVQKGLETLAIRVKAQSANALQLAQWLEQHPAVERVFYPGLPSHPQHALAMAQQSGVGGAVIAFSVRADGAEQARARVFHVIDSTRVCSIATNLGDVKTLISHPASTSHGRLSEAQRLAAGVTQGLARLSVGLEHVPDIQADLARGLDTIDAVSAA